jgi:hypothetical protein
LRFSWNNWKKRLLIIPLELGFGQSLFTFTFDLVEIRFKAYY